jgi:hypothetical protein
MFYVLLSIARSLASQSVHTCRASLRTSVRHVIVSFNIVLCLLHAAFTVFSAYKQLLYVSIACSKGTRVMQALVSCRHSCHAGTRVMQALVSCRQSCHAGTRVMQALVSCRHSCHAGTRVMQALVSCRHSCHAGTRVMQGIR